MQPLMHHIIHFLAFHFSVALFAVNHFCRMDDLFDHDDDNVYEGEQNEAYEEGYDEEITQEDAWVIISKYFEEKGLVRQQIDSFDEFVNSMIQELVDDAGEVKVVPQDQFNGQAIEMVGHDHCHISLLFLIICTPSMRIFVQIDYPVLLCTSISCHIYIISLTPPSFSVSMHISINTYSINTK